MGVDVCGCGCVGYGCGCGYLHIYLHTSINTHTPRLPHTPSEEDCMKKMADHTTAMDTSRPTPKLTRSAVKRPGLTDSQVARAAAAFDRDDNFPGTSVGGVIGLGGAMSVYDGILG